MPSHTRAVLPTTLFALFSVSSCSRTELPPPQDTTTQPLASMTPAVTTAAPTPKPPPPVMSVERNDPSWPSPLSLPCTSDADCGLHRCVPGANRCAFPCRRNSDCTTGAQCIPQPGVCTP